MTALHQDVTLRAGLKPETLYRGGAMNPTDRGWLSCVVTWSVEAAAIDRLLAGGEAFRYLDLDVTGTQSMRIRVTPLGSRVDIDAPTIFGAGVSFLDDGQDIVCLDHQQGERLTVNREWVPPARCEAPVTVAAAPRVEPSVLPDGRGGAAITVLLQEPASDLQYRQRILVDPEHDAHHLTRRLLELILGDATIHRATGYPLGEIAELVSQTGEPVGGAIDELDELGRVTETLGAFQITELTSGDDDIPPDSDERNYRDLNEVGRQLRHRPDAGDDLTDDGLDAGPTATVEARAFGPDTAVNGGAAALRARDDEDPRSDDLPEDAGRPRPTTPPQTTAAVLGLLVEQRLLTELREVVNRALRPIAGSRFTLAAGSTTIPWLEEARRGVLSRRTGPGQFAPGFDTLGFCLLHDVEPPAPVGSFTGPAVEVADWGTIRGRGLLDRRAMRAAKAAVTGGTLSAGVLARLPAAVATALTVAGTDWSMLTVSERLQVAHAVLLETDGTLVLTGLPRRITFNASNVIVGEIANYTASLTLPREPDGTCPLIGSLSCQRGGGIDATLNLGSVRVNGRLNRAPGWVYWIVLGVSALVPLIMPGLAWVMPLLGSIASFVALDAAFASLRIGGLTTDIRLRFVPDDRGLLQPSIAVAMSGSVNSEITSAVPSPLHRIVDLVLQAIVDSGQALLNVLSNALRNWLITQWREQLGEGHPASLFRLQVPVTGSAVAGVTGNYLYLESTLAAPPGYPVPMHNVRADARSTAVSDALRVPADGPSHYLSLVCSENTLNVLLAAAFRRDEFITRLDAVARETLRMLARPPFTPNFSVSAQVGAVAPPQVTLARGLPVAPTRPGTLQADLSLTVQTGTDALTRLLFRITAPVWVVAGSALESATPKINLLTAIVNPLDVLVDLAAVVAQVIRMQGVERIRRTVTEETTDARGHPVTHTYVETAEATTDFELAPADATALAPLALAAARFAFGSLRDAVHVPYRDGIRADGSFANQADPASRVDPINRLTYTVDGTDPDDLPQLAPAFVVDELGFTGGLVFHHLALGGLAATAVNPAEEQLLDPRLATGLYGALGDPDLDPL